ncbi:family 88 glycosyl hydrolase, partial [Clohesyomyces aquaticus]
FSHRMLNSIISRKQGVIASSASTSNLESGILSLSILSTIDIYPDISPTLTPYLTEVLAVVSRNLKNETANAALPLDRFTVLRAIQTASYRNLLTLDAASTDPKIVNISVARDAIAGSFPLQPRNPDGGLWYYAVYKEWSYLDGMAAVLPYMASPLSFHDRDLADMKLQIEQLYDHCWQNATGLLVHGYDWTKTAVWANTVTGASPYVWGRSLGWFLFGIVDAYELACVGRQAEDKDRTEVCGLMKRLANRIAPALVHWADQGTEAWWQLTTYPGREGNWLESSSTALFTYFLLKGSRVSLFDRHSDGSGLGSLQKQGLRAYEYMERVFVTDTGNGTIGYNATVAVCSLNSTATYEYYTQRPIVENGLLGEASFVLASLEVER